MMKIKSLFALLLLSLSTQVLAEKDAEWKLAKDEKGIQVYTRESASTPFKDFKAHVVIKAEPSEVVETIKNPDLFTKWMANVVYSKLLHKDETSQSAYIISKTPFPVKDRDGVFHYDFVDMSDQGTYKIMITGKPNKVDKNKKYVRVAAADGSWTIEKVDEGSAVTYQMQLDPGGSLPGWLANTSVVETPFESLKNLRKRVEAK